VDGTSRRRTQDGQGGEMSGRWVWVPEGWSVMPDVPTREMCDAMEACAIQSYTGTITYFVPSVYAAAIEAAPEPPSGWQQGNLPHPIVGLTYDPSLPEHERYWTGTFDTPSDSEWWTSVPPPPEEGR